MTDDNHDGSTPEPGAPVGGTTGEELSGNAPSSEMGGFILAGIRDTLSGVRLFLLVTGTLAFLGILAFYVSTGLHSVSANEVGILERLGRLEGAPLNPGFHLTLPWPFDRVTKVPVKTVHRLSIDDFHLPVETKTADGSGADVVDPTIYKYALTGDNNIITLQVRVLYTIVNPADYIYRIADLRTGRAPESDADPERLIRGFCDSAVIETLAEMEVDWALTGGKRDMEENIRARLQDRLEDLACGIGVTFVELKQVSPPPLVTTYFNDVVKAKIDKRKYINDAESYRNEALTTAEGIAAERVQHAWGYQNERLEKARGESERFLKQLEEYEGSEEITRYRLYLDCMAALTPQISQKVLHNREGKKDVARVRIRIGQKRD